MHLESVDTELASRLLEDGLHHGDDLRATRSTLRRLRRSVRVHGHGAEAHVLRRVRQVGDHARRVEVARAVGAALLNDDQVDGVALPVFQEAHLEPRLEAGPSTSDVVLLVPRDSQHHRSPDLLREDRRKLHDRRARDLRAEAAAGVLRDERDVLGIHVERAREGELGLLGALCGHEGEEPVSLPVRHVGAWLHRVVRQRLVDDRLLEHERRLGERRGRIALRPFHRALRIRHLTRIDRREVGFGPLELAPAVLPRELVALHVGVGAPGAEAVEGIEHERERLEVDLDLFDRSGSGLFVHSRDRQDRLTLVPGVVGQDRLTRPLASRNLIGAKDIDDTRHRERAARVDAPHPRVGHRAQ
jgi:hypothetical protein